MTETDEELHTFLDFGLPASIEDAIDELGFVACTDVQSQALPYSLSNYDITAQAQTGTGKTAAFLITILAHHLEHKSQQLKNGRPRSLILAPTRELVLQIEADFDKLNTHSQRLAVSLIGGASASQQKKKLERGPVDTIIATPGRLMDFCGQGLVHLDNVEILVIDEADRMLDMGFIPDVRKIVYETPHKTKRQTMFFSATFSSDVKRLAEQWTLEPIHVHVQPDSIAAELVEQRFWMVEGSQKNEILADFIRQKKPAHTLVFVNRRDRVTRVLSFLRKRRIDCDGLSGELPQRKRLATLNRFKEGRVNLVVATDVAGRGIHVEGISHVVNFDLPEIAEDYVHRIGRTGRAGENGISISFVSEKDAFIIPELEELLGHEIECTYPELEEDRSKTEESGWRDE